MTSNFPSPSIRFVFYAFVFAMPIETLDVGIDRGVVSLSGLIGYLFIAVALLQPKVTFGELPRPFGYFVAYLVVFVFLGILQMPEYLSTLVGRLSQLIQMLALFWISYNLFQHQQVIKGALLALSAGCVVLSVLQVGGYGANQIGPDRVSALSQDANGLGSMLSLGLLAFLGLAYGRASQDGRIRWFAWIAFGIIAAGIVLSGSRGAFLSLVAGIMCLAVRPGQSTLRLKITFVAILAICLLVLAVSENPAVRARWDRTFSEGNMSGRERIMPLAWNMFIQSPIVGWGTGKNIAELGMRFGRDKPVDTHNGYLWVLTETGLAGAVPYFFALWLCLRAAWRARHGPEGSLPLALLVCVFLVNMTLTWHYRKVLWLILAYSVASESLLVRRWRLSYQAGSIDKVSHVVAYGLHRP